MGPSRDGRESSEIRRQLRRLVVPESLVLAEGYLPKELSPLALPM
jgi:hypothetical protein